MVVFERERGAPPPSGPTIENQNLESEMFYLT